jgi:probable rRNA maturation factor
LKCTLKQHRSECMAMDSEQTIKFFNADIEFQVPVPLEILAWLNALLSAESRSAENIEYVFCSDEYLLDINKRYLEHDYYTDIISFSIEDDPIEATIYISVDRVKDNAQKIGVEFLDEFHRVLAHGLLHLCGYLDKTDEEEKLMREKENQYLDIRQPALRLMENKN